MPFKKNEELRKGELTSMIDVIFLLLIFFLVTLAAGIKPKEDRNSGIPEKAKKRPQVKNAILDTNYTLRISVTVLENDTSATYDPGKRYLIFLLDSIYKYDIQVLEQVPKRIEEIKLLLKDKTLGFTKKVQLQRELEKLQFYLPDTLPSRELYNKNKKKFETEYNKVIDKIEKKFMEIDSINNIVKNQPDRIKIFLDLDKDIYYKFIVDMNDLYFKYKFNRKLNMTTQDNLYINVNYIGKD